MLVPAFRPSLVHLFAAAIFVISLILFYHSSLVVRIPIPRYNRVRDANATLGFGGILVVSGPTSPRRNGLLQAANVTELEFVIPDQPKYTDEDVEKFKLPEDSKIGYGTTLAWLAHLNALEWFLKSDLETVLILEDDVDWDIHLRTTQIPSSAAALRSLLPPAPSEFFWGSPTDWDLIYMGHCGDYWNSIRDGYGVGHFHPENLSATPHTLIKDNSLPPRYNLHPFTASFLTALNVPEHTRIVHASKFPLCSFGYAVTRPTATKLLTTIAPPHEPPGDIVKAYDVSLLDGCTTYGLRCWTVNPELFHHMPGESVINQVDNDKLGEKHFPPPVDKEGEEQVRWRGETTNIGCGFWDEELRFNGDMTRLGELRKMVREGLCGKKEKATSPLG